MLLTIAWSHEDRLLVVSGPSQSSGRGDCVFPKIEQAAVSKERSKLAVATKAFERVGGKFYNIAEWPFWKDDSLECAQDPEHASSQRAGLAYCMVGSLTYELRDPKGTAGSYFRVGQALARSCVEIVRGNEVDQLVEIPANASDVRIFLPHRPSASE